jgi:hypothetical protein
MLLVLFSAPCFAAGQLIDDFEAGLTGRGWWVFDAKCEIVPAPSGGEKNGTKALQISGPATSYYVGGLGCYLAREKQGLSKYKVVQLDIYGNGPGSGSLKIELIDDDNKGWACEQNEKYQPTADDRFTSEIRVAWRGWKRVYLPLSNFIDDNPLVGDDLWNPAQENGSGGLLQIQLIAIASQPKGKVNLYVDSLQLVE